MCNYYSAWVLLFELQILKATFIFFKAKIKFRVKFSSLLRLQIWFSFVKLLWNFCKFGAILEDCDGGSVAICFAKFSSHSFRNCTHPKQS